ncbi:MAG TPA: 2'-5' RNA ligase family protein [Frankiaceae bacterium]|nr:2'-5' RNA ligase family protein [Frankiaceae bacterium]
MARRNIGVAIEVPQPYGGHLQRWRQRLGDPLALRVPPHVTLLPPTGIPAERLEVVEEHLRRIAAEESAFAITLRGTGTFRPVSPVTFVQLAAGISACERLEARVRSGPLFRELKFNYHPHVTVAQDVDEAALERGFAELATYTATFDVWGFTLFEEGPDKVWRPQRDFPFGHGVPGPASG